MKQFFYKVLALLFIVLLGHKADAQMITKFAGDTTITSGGDFGPATAAGMNQPMALAMDATGKVFIAEGNGCRIRAVASGYIATIAGTGTSGYSGDGGPSTAAQIAAPEGIAVNAAGDLFIADHVNNRIRKIDHTTYIISTVVGTGTSGYSGDGGPATAARLNGPFDIKFDGAGNMYVSDYTNNVIRKINTHDTITTIAGTGAAGYSGDGFAATAATMSLPYRMAFDRAGNLFFVDGNNAAVRKINMTTGIITTIIGSLGSGSSGDGGPASAAKLTFPTVIAFDTAGNMYVADRGNDRIRKVNALTDTINTVVGIMGVAHEGGDGGPASAASLNKTFDLMFDAYDNLYIADINGNVVRKVWYHTPLGVKQFATVNEIAIVPNPNTGAFTVNGALGVATDEPVYLDVTDMLGKTVYSRKIMATNGLINTRMNLDDGIPNGLYLLRLSSGDSRNIVHFVVQR
jgi:trimeric autotransporter adhesin